VPPYPLRPLQFSEADLDAAASAMGYGAVKYADLKNHRLTNYKFR
jgi:arginyl-tRNA synthetase